MLTRLDRRTKKALRYSKSCFYFAVVFRSVSLGAYDQSPAAIWGHWSIWNGVVSKWGLQAPPALKLSRSTLFRWELFLLFHSRGYFNLMNGIFRPIICTFTIVSGDIKRSYWIDFHYSSSSLLGNPSARTRNRSIYPHDFGLDAETITAICLKIASAYTKIKCNWFYTAIWSSGLSIILQTIESIKLIVLHFFTSDQTLHSDML